MTDPYKYPLNECDVLDRSALQLFRNKRQLWLSWLKEDERLRSHFAMPLRARYSSRVGRRSLRVLVATRSRDSCRTLRLLSLTRLHRPSRL
jgi:hypothetical protein